ncbi:MAG: ABC transporter substrate-binding protein [Myxococcaceae bacterium]
MFAASLCVLTVALAGAPSTPLGVVKSADAEVQKVLQANDASVSKLAARADEFVDFGELARRAMGTEWAKLNKKQQDDFTATMKGLLRASYAQKAVNEGRGGSAAVSYGEEKVTGNEAVVNTSIKIKEDTFPVIYKLYRADPKGQWKVYDVVTDDVSLVTTYNDQFRQVLAKKGFDGLLKSLKDKQESLEKQNAAPSDKKD